MTRFHKRFGLWLLLTFAVVIGGCVIFLSPRRKPQTRRISDSVRLNELYHRSRLVLTSRKKYGEVRIPFALRDGLIRIPMIWSGEPVEAIVDTGSYNVDWPEDMHLTATKTGIAAQDNFAAGVVTQGEWEVVPSLKAGGCEWLEMPTVASSEMKIGKPPQAKQTLSKQVIPGRPLLGAPAFQGSVLTIDYQQKEIIVRGSGYDVTRLPRHPHDLLLTPDWVNGYLPIVRGVLAGRPARFALDSGCDAVPINAGFAGHLPKSYFGFATTAKINGLQVSVPSLRRISGSVAGISLQDVEPQVTEMPGDFDALLGTQFLRHFRVTIDYSRGKILLEPYSRGRQ